MTWKELYSETREEVGIKPVKTKDDLYQIMSEAVNKKVNADARLKTALTTFLKPYAFTEYKSAQSYKWAAIIPPTFIQWLAETRGKEITFDDLEPPNISPEDAAFFAGDYSASAAVQGQVRSALIKFGKFITSRYYVNRYPFSDLKVAMPKTKRTIVYSEERLHEFFNIILLGSPEYYTLFWRLLLQTGLRPLHAYSISCGDIEFDKPQEDALGRTFYPIFIHDVLTREKHKVKETVYKKVPPVVTFISESLKKDIIEWCRKNNLTGEGYIFKDFFVLDAATTFIERRRKSEKIAHLLKYKPSQYIQYGLRHTWSSVLYAITSDVGVLIDLGGWGAAGVPLEHYRISMKAREALDIAKKWEMYIPPDKKDKVEAIERIVKEIEVPGAPVTVEAVDELKALLTTLQTQLQDERREREELEKRLAEKGL